MMQGTLDRIVGLAELATNKEACVRREAAARGVSIGSRQQAAHFVWAMLGSYSPPNKPEWPGK